MMMTIAVMITSESVIPVQESDYISSINSLPCLSLFELFITCN